VVVINLYPMSSSFLELPFSFQNGQTALLFQLSLFRTFQKVLNDDITKTQHFTEMKTFAQYILRSFFKIAEKVTEHVISWEGLLKFSRVT